MGRTQARLIRKFLQQIVQNTRTTAGIYTNKIHQIWKNGSRAIEFQTDIPTHKLTSREIFPKFLGQNLDLSLFGLYKIIPL